VPIDEFRPVRKPQKTGPPKLLSLF